MSVEISQYLSNSVVALVIESRRLNDPVGVAGRRQDVAMPLEIQLKQVILSIRSRNRALQCFHMMKASYMQLT
jgi:hypothetical protein